MSTSDASTSPRERILGYVERRIGSRGLAGLSVEEVATALGMSKKTFYKVFPTKESMLEELMGRIVGELGGKIDAVVLTPRNFVEKIHGLMTLLGTVYGRLAIPLTEDLYRLAPGVWGRVEDFRARKIQAVFTALLEQGVAEGYVEQDVNRTVFLLAFLAAVRAVINPRVLAEHPISSVDAIQQMLRIFFAGIMTAGGRVALAELQMKSLSHSS
jgi:AcrR family transcriptional regulator